MALIRPVFLLHFPKDYIKASVSRTPCDMLEIEIIVCECFLYFKPQSGLVYNLRNARCGHFWPKYPPFLSWCITLAIGPNFTPLCVTFRVTHTKQLVWSVSWLKKAQRYTIETFLLIYRNTPYCVLVTFDKLEFPPSTERFTFTKRQYQYNRQYVLHS